MEETVSVKSAEPKKKLSSYLVPYWRPAIISPLFMMGEVICDLLLTKQMSNIVNEGVILGDMNAIWRIGAVMILIAIIGGFTGISCSYTASLASEGFAKDLRVDMFRRVMYLSQQQTDKFTTGSLVTRMTNDITVLQEFVREILHMFVRAPIFFIGGIFFTLQLNVNFGYVVIVAFPFLVIAVIVMLKIVNPMYSKVQKKLDRVNAVVQENVTGARVVKAYTREEHEIGRFDEANTDYRDTSYKVGKVMAFLMPVLSIIMNMSIVAIYYIGASLVSSESQEAASVALMEINAGDVMAAASYITQILSSIMMMSMMFQMFARGKASAQRVCEVLYSDPAILGGELKETDPVGSIEMKNVSFRYPNAQGDNVLENINLSVRKGETIAIIGSTGSGKSTLVSLLPRFYDADEGEIYIDGQNVRDYDLHELRQKFGFVLQKSELFSGTIADNIRWGKDDATDEEVVRAAKIAQADEFITGFNGGYDSVVAEKGASLSGGQKQRMSIARAIVRNPEFLIFDDSTSALDLGTEARLQASLRENMKDTTVIMIAQRIASVKNADRIAVIEHGTITAFAPHDELMKTSEAYREIYASQMKNTDGGEE
ncbi:MAG: ABC transporter ATP-binding protein/permease [Firmicutes bacterium]|nr:ABC transporter ATP-binding protein/permease [Bacillota bacterium]